MRKKFYIVGNLKMFIPSHEEAEQYLSVFRREVRGHRFESVEMIICPPVLYAEAFRHANLREVKLGAQDVFWEKEGAYTGGISAGMLRDIGVEYVIVGHSERRLYGGDTDEIIKAKTDAVLKQYLSPILCIGETAEERAVDGTLPVLRRQVETVFAGLSKMQAEKIIIAYEPRWAIGTDRVPSTSDILQVKVFLRKVFTKLYDEGVAERITIIYGGSVKSATIPAVSWEAELDGVLVGRESLFPYELVKMATIAEERTLPDGA